jgi:hypothetical protein
MSLSGISRAPETEIKFLKLQCCAYYCTLDMKVIVRRAQSDTMVGSDLGPGWPRQPEMIHSSTMSGGRRKNFPLPKICPQFYLLHDNAPDKTVVDSRRFVRYKSSLRTGTKFIGRGLIQRPHASLQPIIRFDPPRRAKIQHSTKSSTSAIAEGLV